MTRLLTCLLKLRDDSVEADQADVPKYAKMEVGI